MALYRLVSVKFSRRVHKKDADGNLMYRDDKSPIYEIKSYGIGATVDLTPAEAKRLKNDIKLVGGTVDQPTALQFVPDDEKGEGDEFNWDEEIEKTLAGNVDQVLAFIDKHQDDDETLEAVRSAEINDKKRKTVLDALDNLLGE